MSRPAVGALSGALLVLALPKPDLAFVGWFALVPLLLFLGRGESWKQAALSGYACGVAFFGGSCYWIIGTMHTYGGLSLPLSVAVFTLFVAVFALHTAAFALVVHRMLLWKPGAIWMAAPAWVAIELVQAHLLFGGFPWMLAGYALVPYSGLLQVAAWTGIYGLSFILVVVNSLIALAIRQKDWRGAAVAAGLVAIGILLPTPVEPAPGEGSADSLHVRIVQTQIPIDFPWGGREEEALLDELSRLSIGDGRQGGLVVWPETPGLFYLSLDEAFASRIGAVAGQLDAHVLVGYVDVTDGLPTNSAGLVSPTGRQVSRYDKIRLVPFGEYVPLRSLLFFAESMVRNVGDFVPGTSYTISSIDGHGIATSICYEDVFPALMRRFTRRGAELIVNITNDGWFGSSSAPYQHLRMAVVRAVESRRYVVRGANTGISAIISPYGRVVSSTLIGERTTLEGRVRYRTDMTFYVRFGDVFAVTALLTTAAFLLAAVRARVRERIPV